MKYGTENDKSACLPQTDSAAPLIRLPRTTQFVSPRDAIARLKEGNARFTAGNGPHSQQSSDEHAYISKNCYENSGVIALGMTSDQAAKRRAELPDQLSVSLFVVRVAGHVVNACFTLALIASTPILKAKVGIRPGALPFTETAFIATSMAPRCG